MKDAETFEKIANPTEEDNQGNIDEKFPSMQEEMDKIDMVFLKEEKQNKSESMNKKASFVNHADHLGRTALHVAVICNNKVAVETLLYLGANPHLTDCFD